jgi:HEAT repeat-containing protein 5
LVAFETSPHPFTASEIESIVSLALKSLDSADYQTRRGLSLLVAGLLASTQIEGAAPPPEPTKSRKTPKDAREEDDPYPAAMSGPVEVKPKKLMSLSEMLAQLSVPFNKSHTSRHTRNGIIDIFATLLTALGTTFVENAYTDILRHLVDEIGAHSRTSSSRFEVLAARHLTGLLLRDIIGARILSEQGQITAIREITAAYLTSWPATMPNQPPPPKAAMIIALNEVTGLLNQLGCSPQPVQEVLYDPLLRLLSHTSYSVQIAAASCLRTFCQVAPLRLSSTIARIVEVLSRNISQLGQGGPPADVSRRALGHAYGLAALVSVIPSRPLYVSYETCSDVMSLAIQLLKQSGNHELQMSGVEIQIAWILVSSLMTVGPNFVRTHLTQLLTLWKNALPKPTSKETSASQVRSELEWAFLLHIRECTLGAILSFLRHGSSKLLNPDIARRLVALLSNGLAFADSFSTQYAQLLQEQSTSTSSTLRLVDHDLMFRRRLLQCFVALGHGHNSATESLQKSLLSSTLSIIADPERYTGSAVQAAIAASSGSFTSLWNMTDGFAFGVTSLLTERGASVSGVEPSVDWLSRDPVEVELDELQRQPILGSNEHDWLCLFSPSDLKSSSPPLPPPPATGLVDAAVELFALYFPLQDLATQTSIAHQMTNFVHSNKLEKNLGRKVAILGNATTSVVGALRMAMQGNSRRLQENMGAQQLNVLLRDVLKVSRTLCGYRSMSARHDLTRGD